MLRKCLVLMATLVATGSAMAAAPAPVDLLQVYKVSVQNNPTFKQALASRQIVETAVPTAWSALLPQVTGSYDGELARSYTSPKVSPADRTRGRSNALSLSITQTIFNFTDFEAVASAGNQVKSAYATYSYAEQTLMQTVASSYLAVLSAEDSLTYAKAQELADYNQYLQAKESFEVGVKTITDVDNAKASYDSAVSSRIAAVNSLADSKESLRAVAGVYYNNLLPLKTLPLSTPAPANIDQWTTKAIDSNWQLKSAHWTVLSDHNAILQEEGGHIPSIGFTGDASNTYNHYTDPSTSINSVGGTASNGTGRTTAVSGTLTLSVPIYSGGAVTASVDKAIAQYNLDDATMLFDYRNIVSNTRQSYLGVISGISKINADYQAIVSNLSSLHGTEEGYQVGTRTMVDVLNAESSLYQAYQQYSTDRYAYINSLINLKLYAGTLSYDDLVTINKWLGPSKPLLFKEPPVNAPVPMPAKKIAKHTPPKKVPAIKTEVHT